MSDGGEYYWCLKHSRVEPREGCRDADRMGPYPTEEAARNWRASVEARNEKWDEEDREWEEGPSTPTS